MNAVLLGVHARGMPIPRQLPWRLTTPVSTSNWSQAARKTQKDWLRRDPLQRKWFFEERDGNCRLMGSFAGQLSETSRIWRQALGPLAEWIAHTLWSATSQPPRTNAPGTRLTQRRKREAKGTPTGTPVAFSVSVVPRESPLVAPKPIRLSARDPIPQARRADTQRRQAAAVKAWKPSDKPDWLSEKTCREKILPLLAGVTVPALVAALAVPPLAFISCSPAPVRATRHVPLRERENPANAFARDKANSALDSREKSATTRPRALGPPVKSLKHCVSRGYAAASLHANLRA
jgi:hypothetical protein